MNFVVNYENKHILAVQIINRGEKMFIFNILILFITFSLGFYVKMHGYMNKNKRSLFGGSFIYMIGALMVAPILIIYFQAANFQVYVDVIRFYLPTVIKIVSYLLLIYVLAESNTFVLYQVFKAFLNTKHPINKKDEE